MTRKKTKLVYGVGVNDLEESISSCGINLPFYDTWHSMLTRCYSQKYQARRLTYIGCEVCDEWKNLSNFKQWYDGNYIEGFVLDKDIIVEGNKIYSPEYCRFVPSYLNSLLTDSRNTRGILPIGVTECKPNNYGRVTSTYQAFCKNGHNKALFKTFKTVEEASTWYSETKTRIVKEQATRAFLDNSIKSDVYLALVRRKF